MQTTLKSPIIGGVLGAAWIMGGATSARADYYYPSVYCAPGYAVHAYDAPVYYERDIYVRPRTYYSYAVPAPRPVVYHSRTFYPTRYAAPRYHYPPRRHFVHPVRAHGVRVDFYRPRHSYPSVRYVAPHRGISRSSIGFSFGRSHYGRHSSRHFGGGINLMFRR